MIGMDFVSFVMLLAISILVSAILHFGLKYYVIPGLASFGCKVVIGWIGAWLGSPVLGHWFEGLNYEQVYFIPAVLGSLALLVLAVDVTKSCVSGYEAGETAPEVPPVAGSEAAERAPEGG